MIVGGSTQNGDTRLPSAYQFDWISQQWQTLAEMDVGRESPACGYDGARVVVAGG